MSKLGKNKKKCEHYRTSGNLQTNKLSKQERNEKRIAKFVSRREAGEAYQYHINPHKKGSAEYILEAKERQDKNVDRKVPIQKFSSIMRKLDNQLCAELLKKKLVKTNNKVCRPTT